MYKIAEKAQVDTILKFFEKDLTHCLYSYIDLKKYGIDNPNLKIYYYEENGIIRSAATSYYNGLQLYSSDGTMPVKETIDLINNLKPSLIASTQNNIDLIKDTFTGSYSLESGYVCGITSINSICSNYNIERASYNDLDEIARLICSDEGVGGHYTVSELRKQLKDRMEEDFGRNYIIRLDGKIVCHAATYAEVSNLSVISGVITHANYRGRGLALEAVSRLCADLLSEGKHPHLFFYTPEAFNLYSRIGFGSPSNWCKLSKIH